MNLTFVLALFSFWPFSNQGIKEEISSIHSHVKIQIKQDPDSAWELAQNALVKAEESFYTNGKARSLFILGHLAHLQSKPALATTYFLEALQIYSELNDTKSLSDQANICLTIGKIFRQHSKNQAAIDYYEQGVEMAMKAGNNKLVAKLLHNTAYAYRTGKNYGMALDVLTKKLEIIETGNTAEKLHTYNELGLVYQCLHRYDDARLWFEKILEIETGEEPSFFRGQALHNLANALMKIGNYKEAMALFNRALLDFEPLAQAKDLILTYQDMADLALLLGQPKLARASSEKATLLLDQTPETHEYFDQKDMLLKCTGRKDSISALQFNRIYNKKQEELKIQMEGSKLDLILAKHENKRRQQEQQTRFVYLLITLTLLFLVVYFYTYYKQRDFIDTLQKVIRL